MRYHILSQKDADWSAAGKAPISNYVWGGSYRPEAYGSLLYIRDRGLAVRMACRESDPRVTAKNFYDPVYKDSCLEFFFSAEKNGRYVNCEMNSAGVSLIGVGRGRHNRTRIDGIIMPPAVTPASGGGFWSVETFFSCGDLNKIFGGVSLGTGSVLYGNFYKCGDDTEFPHYGMWSPVGTEEPDFHRPEYFGELVIV